MKCSIKKLIIGVCAVIGLTLASLSVASYKNAAFAAEGEVPTIDGASVRLSEFLGLRFQTTVNSYNENYVYGTLLLPENKTEEGKELTFETPNVLNIPCIPFENENGTYSFRAVVYNIPESEYSTNVVARSYVKRADGQIEYGKSAVRSISYVAGRALSDKNATFTAEQKTQLEKFAGEAHYTVEHYFENVNGEYAIDESKTQLLKGFCHMDVSAEPLSVARYLEDTAHADRVATGVIKSDGTLVLKLYYKLDRVSVTFNFGTSQQNVIAKVRLGGKVSADYAEKDALYPYDLIGWQKDGADFDFSAPIEEDVTLNAVFANSRAFDDFETETTKWKTTGSTTNEYITDGAISGVKSLLFTTDGGYKGIYRDNLDKEIDFSDVNYVTFKVKSSANTRITLRFFKENNVFAASYLQFGQDVKADGAWHLVRVDMGNLSATGTAFDKTEIKTMFVMSSVVASVKTDDIVFTKDESAISDVKICYDFEDEAGWDVSGKGNTKEYITDGAISGGKSLKANVTAWNGLFNQNIAGAELADVKYVYVKVKTSVNAQISVRFYSGIGIGQNYVSLNAVAVKADGNVHTIKFDISNWNSLTSTGTKFGKTDVKTILIRTNVASELTIDDVAFSAGEL